MLKKEIEKGRFRRRKRVLKPAFFQKIN